MRDGGNNEINVCIYVNSNTISKMDVKKRRDGRLGQLSRNRLWKYGYVLESTSGEYYVGVTDDLYLRLLCHFYAIILSIYDVKTDVGCKFSRTHHIKRVVSIYYNVTRWDENKITKYYMYKYGINKVWGGKYTSEYIKRSETISLKGAHSYQLMGRMYEYSISREITKIMNGKIKHLLKKMRKGKYYAYYKSIKKYCEIEGWVFKRSILKQLEIHDKSEIPQQYNYSYPAIKTMREKYGI